MLSILSAVFGFAAPFLPEVLKLYREKGDRNHELAMLEMRLKHASLEHEWRLEEISARADAADAALVHTTPNSFGVQLLDAAKPWAETKWGRWLISPAFVLFAVLDFVSGMVRPAITYAAVAFWVAVKWAQFDALRATAGSSSALLGIWTEYDGAVLTLVLSYWFGSRAAKAAFGGSASTGRPGGG